MIPHIERFLIPLLILLLSGCAALRPTSERLPTLGINEMPVPETNSTIAHFERLCSCVDEQVTASGLPRPIFGIGSMPNKTGKAQLSGEKGIGHPLTLEGAYYLSEAVECMGFRRVTRTPFDLEMITTELKLGKDGLIGDGKVYSVNGNRQAHRPIMHGQVTAYDIGLNGQFTAWDVIPGAMIDLGAYGAFIGKNVSGARIASDIKAFDAVSSEELTTSSVSAQVVVHDKQIGISRFLVKPMTILIGAQIGSTDIAMHDVVGRNNVLLNTYQMVATLYPFIAPACNQYTAGFMTGNPGARYPEGLITRVMKRPVGPAIVDAKPPEPKKDEPPQKKAEAPKKKVVTWFVPCGKGERDYHCSQGEAARVLTEDIKRHISAGAQVKQIVGFTSSAKLRDGDWEHGRTHAEDIADLLSVPLSDIVRPATAMDLKEIHAPDSPLRGKSGVIIELVENLPGNA